MSRTILENIIHVLTYILKAVLKLNNWKDYRHRKIEDVPLYEDAEIEEIIMYEIIKARKETGVSQYELSLMTRITQADISKLENGKANPTISTLNKIAKVLGKKLLVQFV